MFLSFSNLLPFGGHLRYIWFLFYQSIIINSFFFFKKMSCEQAIINSDLTLYFFTNNHKDTVARRINCRTHKNQVSRLQFLQTLSYKTYCRFLLFREYLIPQFDRFASNLKNIKSRPPIFFYILVSFSYHFSEK